MEEPLSLSTFYLEKEDPQGRSEKTSVTPTEEGAHNLGVTVHREEDDVDGEDSNCR